MSLQVITLDFANFDLPVEVCEFLDDANQRIDEFLEGKRFAEKGFVACDHEAIAKALIAIQNQGLVSGNILCEWGSGFGGVASVAALLGYEACGIEINTEVLEHSRILADEYELDVEFVEGSFIPEGADELIDEAFMENDGDLNLDCQFDDAYSELGMDVADFDIVFIYPWPNEAPLIRKLFDRYAASGALLLIYNDFHGLDVYRKEFATADTKNER